VLKNVYYNVKSQSNSDADVPAFYVPHLSAIQLFPHPDAARARKSKPTIDVQPVKKGQSSATNADSVRSFSCMCTNMRVCKHWHVQLAWGVEHT
jgi:hypothetical protein